MRILLPKPALQAPCRAGSRREILQLRAKHWIEQLRSSMQPNGGLSVRGVAGSVCHSDIDLKLNSAASVEQALEHPQRAAAVAMSKLLIAARRSRDRHRPRDK